MSNLFWINGTYCIIWIVSRGAYFQKGGLDDILAHYAKKSASLSGFCNPLEIHCKGGVAYFKDRFISGLFLDYTVFHCLSKISSRIKVSYTLVLVHSMDLSAGSNLMFLIEYH